MKDVTQEERWTQWLVQARNFARGEQFHDAVMRAKLVRKEIQTQIDATRDPERRERLQRHLRRVEETLGAIEAQRKKWHERIAELRRQRMDNAAEEMKRPLPDGLPGRRTIA
jgi:hypothetical protein